MNYRNSSPTSAAAIGNVDRQYAQLRREAEQIRRRYLAGKLTAREEAQARQRFIGVFRRLLDKALSGT